MHAARELQAIRSDLKNAQEEFNSARQISLQKQNELQNEVNQLKMSNELREKDIDRLNNTLQTEKSQREQKVQELQQQLEDAMNELETAKTSQRSLDMNCKIIESERKNIGDRLQVREFLAASPDLLVNSSVLFRLPSARLNDTKPLCQTWRLRPNLQRAKLPASRTSWSRRLLS